jgi:hypothetical protein
MLSGDHIIGILLGAGALLAIAFCIARFIAAVITYAERQHDLADHIAHGDCFPEPIINANFHDTGDAL